MKRLWDMFAIKISEASNEFEVKRKIENCNALKQILMGLILVQCFLLVVRWGLDMKTSSSETVFYLTCVVLNGALIAVVQLGQKLSKKKLYFGFVLFLSIFLSAVYSWYGVMIGFGGQLYILVLILTAIYIIDSVNFRISTAISSLFYLSAMGQNSSFLSRSSGDVVLVIILTLVLWVYTGNKHNQAICIFNGQKTHEKQNEDLEEEIAYRSALSERLAESEHRFRMFMNHVPTAIIVLDQGRITYANKGTTELTGYSRAELEVLDWSDLVESQDAFMLSNVSEKIEWDPETDRVYTVHLKSKSGKSIWTRLQITDFIDQNRRVKLISGYNIDSQKHYESQLNKLVRMKEDMLLLTQSILGIDDLNIILDIVLDGAIDSLEMADRGSILIMQENNMLKPAAYKGYSHSVMENFEIAIEETFLFVKTRGQLRTTEIINDVERLKGVQMYEPQTDSVRPVRSTIGTPIYYQDKLYGMIYLDSNVENAFKEEDFMMVDFMRTQIEIAINKQALMDEAVYLSRYDKMTGVFNRRWFEEYYQTMEVKAERYNDAFALVMFDLNGLKPVNDAYGHLEGDALIRGFAERLKKLTRASDILARFGGDEFIGIFHEITAEDLQKRMTDFANDFIENPIESKSLRIYCRFSYGASYFNIDSKDYETLVKLADERMYYQKQSMDKTYVEILS